MSIRRKIAFGVSLAFTAGLAYAADQTILGNTLTVKNPSTADKRKVVGKGKEKNSPNAIVGNPTTPLGGATLTISADGGTPTTQTFSLLQGTNPTTGKPYWSGDAIKGFKYKDPKGDQSAVKSAQIKKSGSGVFIIKVVVNGKNGPVLVIPPNPGTSGCLLLAITGGDSYSVAFPSGNGVIVNKDTRLYKHKKVTAEGSCVPPTTTTTTSTTTSSTTTIVTTTTTSSTTTTTLYGSPSKAFVDRVFGLLD
jgi:hypothetical protein